LSVVGPASRGSRRYEPPVEAFAARITATSAGDMGTAEGLIPWADSGLPIAAARTSIAAAFVPVSVRAPEAPEAPEWADTIAAFSLRGPR